MQLIYGDFDITNFWKTSDFARRYVDAPPDQAVIDAVQERLGHRLPAAYVELAQHQNGGAPLNTCIPTASPTTWAEDHVAIVGIYSIGNRGANSLCGKWGSAFWVESWGYPPIGIYFADCPSAGHDMICLDYRGCGPHGEPAVVHVDQEHDYRVTFLADSFEHFIRALKPTDAFEP